MARYTSARSLALRTVALICSTVEEAEAEEEEEEEEEEE